MCNRRIAVLLLTGPGVVLTRAKVYVIEIHYFSQAPNDLYALGAFFAVLAPIGDAPETACQNAWRYWNSGTVWNGVVEGAMVSPPCRTSSEEDRWIPQRETDERSAPTTRTVQKIGGIGFWPDCRTGD